MKRLYCLIFTVLALLLPMTVFAGVGSQWISNGPFSTGLGNRIITALKVAPDTKTLYAGNGSGSVFKYVVVPPTVTTNDATSITSSGATLNGTANANFADSAVSFEYVTSSTLAATPATVSGNTPVSFSGALTGLTPGTSYNFWAVATNNGGTTLGSVLSFTTKLIQSITFGSAPTVLKDGTGTVSATAAPSLLTVAFTSLTPTNCSTSGTNGSTVTGLIVGTNNCTIAANQAGDSSYDAAPQVTQTFSILQPRTITAVAGSGGSITPGTVTIAVGTTKQFTITPDANYRLLTPLTTTCPTASLTGDPTTGMIFTTAAITDDCSVTPVFISTTAGTYDVTINKDPSTGGDWSGTVPDVWTPTAAGATLNVTDLQTKLASGSVIVATNSAAGFENGDINVEGALTWSSDSTLNFYAYNDVKVTADITASGNSAGIQLSPNNGSGAGVYKLDKAAVVTLSGSSPSLYIDGNSYTVIKTAIQLQGISDLAGRYALGTNIADVSATVNNFAPIGNSSTPFTGIFDGLGHIIGNLGISRTSTADVGLFGYTSNATLRNVGLVGGVIAGANSTGALTGQKSGGTITNSYNSNVAVSGTYAIGGLVGAQMVSGSISNCYNSGTVTGTGNNVGGLVGYNQVASISNSYNSGNVTGTTNVGGITGTLFQSGTTLSNVYNSGTVSGSASVGGIVGSNTNGTVNNSFWDKTVNSGLTDNGLGAGKTTAEMKQLATYGWSIASTGGAGYIWRIYEGFSYPLLRNMLRPLKATASSSATKTYDGNPYADAAGTTYTPAVYDSSKLSGTNGYSFSPAGGINVVVGGYTITPAVYSTPNGYDITAVSGHLDISKASSTTAVTCQVSDTYTGSALTPCTVSVTGAGGLSLAPSATYANNTNAGTNTASASYTYAGDSNHNGSSDTKNFTIDKASSTSAITCPANVTYTGSALIPCTVLVTGAGGLSLAPAAVYSNNTNAGSASADYTYVGDSNHNGSSATTKNFTIDTASSTTTVTCTAGPFTYKGSAYTPCSVTVTGVGGLSLTPAPGYANNTGAGTATASYSYTGDSNHGTSSDSKNFTIDMAPSTTVVTCPANVTYTGSALTPCTVAVTGAGGLSSTPTATYVNNINAGTNSASASYTFSGDIDHFGSSDSRNFTIDKAVSTISVTGDTYFGYDGTVKGPDTVSTSGSTGAVTYSYAGVAPTVYAASATKPTEAGSYTATATLASDSNYNGAVSDAKVFSITTVRHVTTNADSGVGSLRYLIEDPGTNPGDIIDFNPAVTGTITLASTLSITKDLTIIGPATGGLTISGNNTVRVFYVAPSQALNLSNLTIANGYYNEPATSPSPTLPGGGAISNYGTLSVDSCTFLNNRATSDHTASGILGGAINNIMGTVNITNSTFTGNSAISNVSGRPGQGGAIGNIVGTVTITNSTFSGNSATTDGGSIVSGPTAVTIIANSTISNNSVTDAVGTGGGIKNTSSMGTLRLQNSIVANNTAATGTDISGKFDSQGHNLIGTPAGSTYTPLPSDITGDPLLGALANNGGLTQTMAPLYNSTAINGGDCTSGPAADQRGMARPQDTTCDIGAYERGVATSLAATGGTGQSAIINTAFANPLTAIVKDSLGGVLDGISVAFDGPATGAGIAAGTDPTSTAGIASFLPTANGNAGSYTATAKVGSLTDNFSLTNIAPPSIATVFGAASIPLSGGSTTLTFTLTNPAANAISLSGIAFTDSLPAGLVVATPNALTNSCGGSATAAAGSGSISISGVTLASGASCTLVANVSGTSAGVKNNSVQITSTEGGDGNTSNSSITVVSAPVISKVFGAATIPLNSSTSLTFTIENNNTSTALTGVSFSDTLPTGLVVTTPNNLTGSCGGGTITATAGGSSISLSGATVAASSSCTFAVDVTGTTAGGKTNTTGNVTSTNGSTGGTATASINIISPPTISNVFGATGIPLNGTTSLTFTIQHTNSSTGITGVGFSDTLPSGLVVATPNGLANTCNGTATAVTGSGSISLASGLIPTESSCTVTVNVTGTTFGVKTNTSGAVSSTNGGTGSVSNTVSLDVGVSTITATGTTSFIYNGAPQGPSTSTKTGSNGTVTYSYSGTSYGPTATKPTAVGSYTVTATVAADANYDTVTSAPLPFTIAYSSEHPALVLSTLADGATSSTGIVNISGTATAINGMKGLTVNTVAVPFSSDGSFSYPVQLVPGSNSISVVATDNADLTTTVTRAITLDATAPLIRLSGDITDNSVTSVAGHTISGNVFAIGTTVTISLNGGTAQAATMTGDVFNLNPVTLVPGLNTIEIKATDSHGKSSSIKVSVTLSSALTLGVTTPAHDIKASSAGLTLNGTVAGTPPLTVTVTMDGTTYTPAIAGDGSFSQALTFVSEKNYPIVVTASDTVNSATVIRNVTYALLGDQNGTGGVTIEDAVKAYRISSGLDQEAGTDMIRLDVAPLDANGKPVGNGIIDLGDVILLLRYVAGVITW